MFQLLRADPGRVGLDSLLREIKTLDRIRALKLSPGILDPLHPDLVKRLRRRAATESAWEARRHPDGIRLPLLAFYGVPRGTGIIDGLVEPPSQIVHRITMRAVIFPVADESVCENLVKVRGAGGLDRNRQIHTVIRAVWPASCLTSLATSAKRLAGADRRPTQGRALEHHNPLIAKRIQAFGPAFCRCRKKATAQSRFANRLNAVDITGPWPRLGCRSTSQRAAIAAGDRDLWRLPAARRLSRG